MKHYLLISLALLLTSCNSMMEKSIEERATEQLQITMKEALTNPDDATLSGVRTEYQSDSLCIIEFKMKAKNGLGMMLNQNMEYIYIDLDKMSDKELKGQLEGFYYIGDLGNLMYYDELKSRKEELKEFIDEGFKPEDILTSTVFKVSETYHNELIKFANHSPSHSKIKDKLIFSAAWLKIAILGREVNNDSKEIKL